MAQHWLDPGPTSDDEQWAAAREAAWMSFRAAIVLLVVAGLIAVYGLGGLIVGAVLLTMLGVFLLANARTEARPDDHLPIDAPRTEAEYKAWLA